MQHPKQLSLPFAEANYDLQPLADEVQYRIRRLETDYLNYTRFKPFTLFKLVTLTYSK